MPTARSERLDEALRRARDTRRLELRCGALADARKTFHQEFGDAAAALMIADPASFAGVARAGAALDFPGDLIMFKELHAEWASLEAVDAVLHQHEAVPVAVGSGTINDLVKLAAHRLGRPYLCVATAASMDGYTAFGASITKDGAKQTFDCPAPRVVIADIDVIRAAPPEMTASGYADLLAKLTAGADWMLADALGVEPIDGHAWDTVQTGLREALSDPEGCARGDVEPITQLTEGLTMSGFAMQAAKTSRPASGAEHQFSHLWDMEHHMHNGVAPSHGFKVGVATVAVAKLYEALLEMPIEKLDVQTAVAAWPTRERLEESVRELFDTGNVRNVAMRESAAKYASPDELRKQLTRLRESWPALATRLRAQLPAAKELAAMLNRVGAPSEPGEIGISRDRLRLSFYKALHIRRRFTVLDVAARANLLDGALDRSFAS